MQHRRRTDQLPAPTELPADPLARSRAACEMLQACGFESALALQVLDDRTQGMLCAASGRIGHVVDVARGLAEEVARTGRALQVLEADDSRMNMRWRFAAMSCGELGDGALVVVVADPRLTRREAEAIAAWIAPGASSAGDGNVAPAAPGSDVSAAPGSDVSTAGDLARELAAQLDADVVVLALFAQSGILLNLHVRSGALLRSWRVPVETVWGEAARHSAAYVLGDLHLHAGAESLASLGMCTSALVGIDNGKGLAVGAVGIASHTDLCVDVAERLLTMAPDLGPRIMEFKSRNVAPRADETVSTDLRSFASLVGCRRFAVYSRTDSAVRLVAAFAEDGTRLVAPPDPDEEQLVCWAAQKELAVTSDDAAAILVGPETILYAQDPRRAPMERLRQALQDLRDRPQEQDRAA